MKKIFIVAAVAATLCSCSEQAPKLYSWEKGRTELPEFQQMTLCYGGSHHRSPYKWTAERYAPMVTAVDAEGKEQWLFDSFMAIEVADGKILKGTDGYTYGFGYPRQSADKASWQRLIDYWFEEGYGFDALDEAVGAAIERIGEPNHKRTVVMNMPDPIIHMSAYDTLSSTTYWGKIDDRQLDFKQPEDRLAAMKWFVDQVREKWNEAAYQNIELIGFYAVSEDLAIPGDGWSPEYKHYEDIYPAISDYIHSLNEGIYWIPYYEAAPYRKWRDLGIDVTVMQPNMYWANNNYTFEHFLEMITAADLGMELEFDAQIVGSTEKALFFKSQFRRYLDFAKANGIYGNRQFALFSDTNGFYDLATSDDPVDQEFFAEFVKFLLEDPRRLD